MADHHAHARLADALEDLGRAALALDERDLVPGVVARVRAARGRNAPPRLRRPARPAVAVAWIVALALAVAVALPGPRDAVARLFGIDGVRVTSRAGLPADLHDALELGRPVDLDTAARLARDLPLAPRALGRPDAAFAGRPAGGVSLVWGPSPDLPEVASTGVGALVTAFPGTTDRELVEKQLLPGTTIEHVTVGGAAGSWIAGDPHVFLYLDGRGDAQHDTVRLAGNTLLWSSGATTYRFESALDRDAALALASAFEPLAGPGAAGA
jgi:hypothetical protein